MRRLFTIGHSTRSLDELVQLLRTHGVRRLADVRSYPASRRHPHFSREALTRSLPEQHIDYEWMQKLGGRRKSRPGRSPNSAWQVQGFRAYADYMGTPEFQEGLARLEEWAEEAPTAFMCAEAYFRKCHRQLLSDTLVARGWDVLHIASTAEPQPHRLTEFGRVTQEGGVVYPGEPELGLEAYPSNRARTP